MESKLVSAKLEKYINRYKLEIIEFKNIDLRRTYAQYNPEYKFPDFSMFNSPHHELAQLYYDKGDLWLRKNFHKTKYFSWRKNLTKKELLLSKKIIFLFDSMKIGYLRNGHKKDYIVVLNTPFIASRYNVKNMGLKTPEVFIGHHRIGALLALGETKAEVVIAKDKDPGSKKMYGKLHDAYKDIERGSK